MHVKACKDTIQGAYGIVAGDPGRISRIAAFFDEPAEVATSRGFVVYRGKLEGVSVFAAAHGIGSAGAAIVFEELALLGCHTVIRVGTCGSLQAGMCVGDVVISTGCIRDDGTTSAYVPLEFPALASSEIVTALQIASTQVFSDKAPGGGSAGKAAVVERNEVTERPVVSGVTHCKGSFYSEIPGYVPDAAGAEARWDAWVGAGAVATEMEGAALFIIGGARRMRVGMVLAVLGVTKAGPGAAPVSTAEALGDILTLSDASTSGKDKAIAMGVQALRNIIRHDIGAPDDAHSVAAAPHRAAPAATAPSASAEADEATWSAVRAFAAGAVIGGLAVVAAWRNAAARD